ncbi:DUF1206 domain-containing protein [Streptomyces niveus]|uniref:DUF1206 domain-containing protein n=1 Tax=Streptomyces niveus TaxID=193462 RepID=UPI003F64AE07
MRSFADAPAGRWLLALVALGLVLFGVFSFAMAAWRTNTPMPPKSTPRATPPPTPVTSTNWRTLRDI